MNTDIQIFNDDLPDGFAIEGDLAIDTEAMGLKLNNRDRLCLLQLSNGDGKVYLIRFDRNYEAPNLRKLFLNPETTKIFHYARFDVAAIKFYLNIDIKKIFCTKIASKLCRTYTESHGLKDLCRELLGIQLSKQQQSSYWGADKLSKDQIEYAARDVLYLHNLRASLTRMLIKEKRLEMAEEIFKFIPMRVDLDLQGFEEIDIFAH